MNNTTYRKYIDSIERELKLLIDNSFTGNIQCQFNFKDGIINNINFNLNKSIRFIDAPINKQ